MILRFSFSGGLPKWFVSVGVVFLVFVPQAPVSIAADPDPFPVSVISNATPEGLELTAVGGTLFFAAEDPTSGQELWVFQTSSPAPLSSVSPSRVYESRNGPNDKTFDGQFQATGRCDGGSVTEFTITGRAGVTTDASAVFLNVAANAVLTKIGTNGKVCVFSNKATDRVIDVNGYVPN